MTARRGADAAGVPRRRPASRARGRWRRHRRRRAGRGASAAPWWSSRASAATSSSPLPDDLELAGTALLDGRRSVVMNRVGLGFDVHPFGDDDAAARARRRDDRRRAAARRPLRRRRGRARGRRRAARPGRPARPRHAVPGVRRAVPRTRLDRSCSPTSSRRVAGARLVGRERRRRGRGRDAAARAARRRDGARTSSPRWRRCASRWARHRVSVTPKRGEGLGAIGRPRASRSGPSRCSTSARLIAAVQHAAD